MITINNLKFAENNDELVESLFHSGGTASGTYKVKRRRGFITILLYKASGQPFAHISNNKSGEFFGNYTELNGKPFYQVCLSSDTEKAFGMDTLSYCQKIDLIKSLLANMQGA